MAIVQPHGNGVTGNGERYDDVEVAVAVDIGGRDRERIIRGLEREIVPRVGALVETAPDDDNPSDAIRNRSNDWALQRFGSGGSHAKMRL